MLMIIHLFVFGLLIRVAGSQRNVCLTDKSDANKHLESIHKCIDHLFGVCTKAANDINDLFDVGTKKTTKDEKCKKALVALTRANDNLDYLMIMEKYDHEADYYGDLIKFPHDYIYFYAYQFKDNEDHNDDLNKYMPLVCPNYTMKACRSLLTFCEHTRYGQYVYCTDPSFIPYKEYLQCYFTPSKAKADCRMLCDTVLTKKLFGIEKTDDVHCKNGKDRCENIETAGLIQECEGTFKDKCDVNDANTYTQCEEAIRSMKVCRETAMVP